ncbi:MAG: cytochrome c oxidase assembly protein [Acidobacteria bacterium]|nr:cytochrome c oxidase assembly protein [Acidobacteriota bacterium]
MTRPLAFAAGVTSALAAWTWYASAAHTFTGHMAVHLIVVAIAAPLLASGTAGTWFDPRLPGSPIAASIVELLVVWTWHLPRLHEAARHSDAVWMFEQATFLLSGWWFWRSLLDHRGRVIPALAASGVLALAMTLAHMTLLGALLALAPRPFVAHGGTLADQQLGGVLMLVVSAVVYGTAGLVLTAHLLRTRPDGAHV